MASYSLRLKVALVMTFVRYCAIKKIGDVCKAILQAAAEYYYADFSFETSQELAS
jgi:hypothetical protein